MISCTDYIPAYSLLFEFIEQKSGHSGVVEYWNYISDHYVEPSLGTLVREKGIGGCWEYYNAAHTSEAAEVCLKWDEEANEMTIDMRRCPSKGHLLDMEHMEPYHDYCGHCMVIYKKVLNRYGIEEIRDHSHVDEARCFRTFRKL